MWEKVVWIHPVKKRFNTRTGLTGKILQQELTGSQTRAVVARGATHAEYAELVREHEGTPFVAEYDFGASPSFRHGYEAFDVNVSGKRLVPAATGASGGASSTSESGVDGSYLYSPGSAAL